MVMFILYYLYSNISNAETDGDAKAYLNPETINRKERDMRRVFGLGFWKWRSDNIWQWRNV